MGFTGVQNFPTVGLFDGVFRQNLEETGMGYALEVEMIRLAAERDLLTAPYVFDVDSAVAMAEAGADVLVPHLGLTTSGTIGAQTAVTLSTKPPHASRRCATPPSPSTPTCIVLCHGGPIAEPEDAAYVLANTTGVVGFFGASSMERLPDRTRHRPDERTASSRPSHCPKGEPHDDATALSGRRPGRGTHPGLRLGHHQVAGHPAPRRRAPASPPAR